MADVLNPPSQSARTSEKSKSESKIMPEMVQMESPKMPDRAVTSQGKLIVKDANGSPKIPNATSKPFDEQPTDSPKLRRNSDPDYRSMKHQELSDESDYDHVSADEEDARTRLKRVTIKSIQPTRGKLTKAGREEKDHHEDIGLEELKALFRAARRESRDQASEIRELEKQNHRLQEAYNKIRAEFAEDPRRFTKVERNRYVEHFQLMENHIHWQEHEQTKLKSHIEMLTKQTRDANGEREDLEGNNRKLQKQIQDLQSSLTECKDDLLRMQPSNQIADSEIGDRYSNLAQQITSWVDDQTEDSEALEERFSSVSRGGLEIDPILNMYIENRHVKLIQDHPDALPLVVQYLIHRCLEQYVMGNGIYFYGLDIRNIGLLQEVEAGMKLLEPRRDGVTLRRWRSETLAGLSRSKDFATARQQQGQTLAKTLYFALARLLRGPKMQVNDEGWEELHKQIILPAIELATAMRLSTTDYEVVSRNGGDRDDQVIVHHNEIPHYQMVDNASHKIVRPDSALRLGEEGRIGTELLTVTPALMRTKNDGVHRVVISKPTILVKLDEPMGKRSKGSRPFGAWTPNWFGGDSTVE